jgi:hypothetical protein
MKRLSFNDLPLFADEREIAQIILGTVKADQWSSLVPIYERQGFPRIDPITGGRYVPAVKAFFDRQYGLVASGPLAPDGTERPDTWNAPKRRA